MNNDIYKLVDNYSEFLKKKYGHKRDLMYPFLYGYMKATLKEALENPGYAIERILKEMGEK